LSEFHRHILVKLPLIVVPCNR